MSASDLPTSYVDSDSLKVTRDDVAFVVSVYKRESNRLNTLGALGILAGAGVGVALVGMGQLFHWIDDWVPFFLLTGGAFSIAALVAEWILRRRTVDRLQLYYAFCGEPLLGSGNPKEVASRAEITVATGSCSCCGHGFLANEA